MCGEEDAVMLSSENLIKSRDKLDSPFGVEVRLRFVENKENVVVVENHHRPEDVKELVFPIREGDVVDWLAGVLQIQSKVFELKDPVFIGWGGWFRCDSLGEPFLLCGFSDLLLDHQAIQHFQTLKSAE